MQNSTHGPDTHIPDKRTEVPDRMKRARPNRMRTAQVMPPHQVDLTLTPGIHHDIHVPAHVTGGDLSREGPLPAGEDKGKGDGKP